MIPLKAAASSASFFIALVVNFNAFSQPKSDSLEMELTSFFIKNRLPGLNVTMADANGILYQHSFGYADIRRKKPFDANTVENIGSVSKTFIACAVMKAIEQGYFTLETNINDILPFKVVNPWHPEAFIKVKDLVTHTSGIIDNQEVYRNCYHFEKKGEYSRLLLTMIRTRGYHEKVTDTSLKQFLCNYLSVGGKWYYSQNFSKSLPGRQYMYSNIASSLAAYIVEISSGLSFAAYTERYILQPLHMLHSGWFADSAQLQYYARLYFNSSRSFPLYSLTTYPDGGLRTSAGDLTHFLVCLINGLKGHNDILSSNSFKEMFAAQLPDGIANLDLQKENRGVFWNLYSNGMIDKDGDDPGISTYIFVNRKTGVGGFFLCNRLIDNNDDLVNLLHRCSAKWFR